MKKLKEQILQLTDIKEWIKLEELLLSTESNVLKIIKTFLYYKEGLHLLNCILKSLQCKTRESTSLKSKIYVCVLKLMKNREDTDEKENGKLVTVLNMHVDTFPSMVLVNLINIYVEHLKAGFPFYGRWTDFLGKLLSAASSRDDIIVDGKAMGREDFGYYILRQLCDCKWNARTAIILLPILKDAALPKEELTDVVEKLHSVLRDVDYPSVPPIVYHAILLCQRTLPGAVLDMVVEFFNERDQAHRKETPQEDSEGICAAEEDKIEQSTLIDLVEAQGTVILHITQLAQYDPLLMKEYLKVIKCTWLPDKVFTPFNLALALSLACIERYKDKIIDCLKTCVLRYFKEQDKRQKSLWFSDAFKSTLDLMEVFKITVSNCKSGWDQVSESLVVLFFRLFECGGGLLGETPPRHQSVALASSVLPLVFKKEPRLAPDILKQLSSLVLTASSSMQYVELLGRLVRASPLVLLDHVPLVRELLEQLPFLPGSVASSLLGALHPLLKMSMPLKDALIVLLRKMLFSRQVDNRITAVRGFLQILRHFRILGTLPSSQASMSFSSTLSHVSADVHSALDSGTNEALCLELLGVLRRVCTQQSEVRSALYDGLYDVVRSNPLLGPSILRLLQQHLTDFVDSSQDALNPLLLQKAITGQGETSILVEPLGQLLACLVRCKIYYQGYHEGNPEREDDEEGATTMIDVKATFDALTECFAYCDLDDLNLGAGSGRLDHLRAELIVESLDALMEENFCNGALRSEDKMKKVLALFKTQKEIIRLVRERAKAGKKDKGDGVKAKGRPSAISSKVTPALSFKSVLSLHVAVAILRVIFVGDSSAEERCVALLEGNVELEIYVVSVVVQTVAKLKEMPPHFRETLLPDLRVASGLLLKECGRCLARDNDYDDNRQVRRARCFVGGLHSLVGAFVKYYKEKLPHIFREMTGKSPTKEYDELLYLVSKECLKMKLRILQSEDGQAALIKEATLLVQMIGKVAEQMTPGSPQLTKLMEAVNQLCKDQAAENAQLAETLVGLLLVLTERVRASSSVLRSLARVVHHRLGDIEQDVALEATYEYCVVTEESAVGVLTALCAYCEEVFTVLDVVLCKLRECLVGGVRYPEEDLDRIVCLKLAVIIHALHEVFQSAVPRGAVQYLVLRTTTKFYACITAYVKYQLALFRTKSSRQMSEKFEKLIHVCNNMLKGNAFRMITYTQNDQARASKAFPARALKETRLIPDLIYAMEQYENQLVQLTRKSKVNLLAGTKLTTSRDFRIIGDAIKPAEEEADSGSEKENGEQQEREVEEEEGADEHRSPTPPLKKKRKTSH